MPKTDKAQKNKTDHEGHSEHMEKENEQQQNEPQTLSQESLLQQEVTRLQKELSEEKNRYLLLLAESENSRKRITKDKFDSNRFAIVNVIKEFIQPLDNFEAALACAENMNDEIKNWAMGFQMILAQLREVLLNQGIEPFDSLGQSFNPHKHEAVETINDSEKEEGIITKEFCKGYQMQGKVIRAARVVVVKHEKQVDETQNEAQETLESDENQS